MGSLQNSLKYFILIWIGVTLSDFTIYNSQLQLTKSHIYFDLNLLSIAIIAYILLLFTEKDLK